MLTAVEPDSGKLYAILKIISRTLPVVTNFIAL